jgi:hypothetical protein
VNKQILNHIAELENTIIVAGLNYDIWWGYKNKFRKQLLNADDHYPLFFQTSLHAHFIALIIALYRLFEKRTDTVNFYSILDILQQSSQFTQKDIENIMRRIERLKPLWIKIGILRNKVFGHRTNKFDITPWQQASISANEIRKLIKDAQKLLNHISQKWDRNTFAFNLSATSDTRQLLEDIWKFRKL